MSLLIRKTAIVAKLETVYGTDSAPTGAANAIRVRNLQWAPMTVESQARELVQPYLGNSEDIVGAFWGGLQYDVEAAGSGAAGTAPKCGPLLRGCGMAEVISAGTSVTYTPVSAGFESLTQYAYLDGVLHKFKGVRGNAAFRGNNRAATMFAFNWMGLFVPVADAALPTVDYSGWIAPLAMNTANTPTFTLHGVAASVAPMRNLTIDLANQLSYSNLVGGEAVEIGDRKPVGTVELQAGLMATKNWFAVALANTTGAMQLVHGTTAGNIVEINAPAVQVTGPTYGDFEGKAMVTAGLKFMPTSAGNDELSFVFR